MASPSNQRGYRAPCPGCGAPVEFRSAQSTHAVCGYCQSTVVRNGDTLSRLGKMAELFDDHSPLQLYASGTWEGKAFTLVGRLQYRFGEGTWTEWIALLPDGSTAWLSEDNGAYVFAKQGNAPPGLPSAEQYAVGQSTKINGQLFSVASNQEVSLVSAQGELPKLPDLGKPFTVVELRSDDGRVLSIDYGPTLTGSAPVLSMGKAVLLEDLKLQGLRSDTDKQEKGQSFACPSCGASVQVNLASSKSITCASCNSIIDVSQGVGAQLQHAAQDEPVEPLIALGSTGKLQGTDWQVVGFQHRTGQVPGDDETFGWDEYLLYNQKRGFTFLVDSTEGWSLVKPTTGAPTTQGSKPQSVKYLGTRYQLKESYDAQTTYVAGEFYWQVQRGQQTENSDYVQGALLLSRERSTNEETWSSGSKIDSAVVVAAFGLQGKEDLARRQDVSPFVASPWSAVRKIFILMFVLFVLAMLLTRCSSTDCDPALQSCVNDSSSSNNYGTGTNYGSRTSGGSWGGSSSGGGHK